MAYRRSIIARSKLFYQQQQQQRFSPSFSHISSSSDREELPAKTFSRNSDYPSRFPRYNAAANSLLLSGNVSRLIRSNIPAGFGLLFRRNFSKVIDGGDLNGVMGEVGDKAVELNGVMGEVGDKAVEAAAPVLNEVAVVVADLPDAVAAFHYLIDYVHCYTGFQWWAAIAATTFLIRFIQLPIIIHNLKHKALSDSLRMELQELKRNGPLDPTKEKEFRSRVLKVLLSYPLFPLLFQFLSACILSFAILNMVVNVPSFATGGTLWFIDLKTPDFSMRLPILFALTLWLRIKLDPAKTPPPGNILCPAAVLVGVVAIGAPSALHCYWITSNLFSIAFAKVLMDPRVPKLLGISTKPPSTPK